MQRLHPRAFSIVECLADDNPMAIVRSDYRITRSPIYTNGPLENERLNYDNLPESDRYLVGMRQRGQMRWAKHRNKRADNRNSIERDVNNLFSDTFGWSKWQRKSTCEFTLTELITNPIIVETVLGDVSSILLPTLSASQSGLSDNNYPYYREVLRFIDIFIYIYIYITPFAMACMKHPLFLCF